MDYRYYWFLAFLFLNGFTMVGITKCPDELKVHLLTISIYLNAAPFAIKLAGVLIYTMFDLLNQIQFSSFRK